MNIKTDNLGLIAFQVAIFISLIGLNPSAGAGGDGSVLRQAGWMLLATASVVGIFSQSTGWQTFLEDIRRRMSTILLISAFGLLALLSASWSEAPIVTFKRATLLGLVVLISLGASVHPAQSRIGLPLLLIKPLSLILALSILFSIVAPSIAFSSIGWQGASGHKNEMGQLSALIVMVGLFGNERLHAGRRIVVVLAGLVALVMSSSGTAMVCLASGLLAVSLVRLAATLNKHPSWLVPAFMAALSLLIALFAAFVLDVLPSYPEMKSALLAVLGKSETLTGRTALWDLVLEQSRYRSDWIGGGYGAFWDTSYARIGYIVRRLGFMPIQAHNGYLDIFNDLGYVGLALATAVLATHLGKIVAMAFRHPSEAEVGFHIALAVYVVLANCSESSLFRTTQFLNLLFLFSLFSVGMARAPVNPLGTIPFSVQSTKRASSRASIS